jgi:hypothetical protein
MSKVRDSVEDLRIIDDKAPIDNPSFTGPVTATGDTTIGAATAATNVQLILNGVASKAQRIKFAESGVDKWFIGQGAASETDAFEIYNSNGQMSLSIAKATSNASFSGSLIASGGVYLGGTGAANKLDDYEEGTWTPTGASLVSVGSIHNATYTKVGNLVTVNAWIKTNATGTSIQISGLPFAIVGRTTALVADITNVINLKVQALGNTIYGYSASTTGTNNDYFISASYHVA